MKKDVFYGRKYETLEAKIKERLSLSLPERYVTGLVKGFLAKILERNQKRLYGRGAFKSIQILKQKSG
jgi:hypothetical protein